MITLDGNSSDPIFQPAPLLQRAWGLLRPQRRYRIGLRPDTLEIKEAVRARDTRRSTAAAALCQSAVRT